MLKLSIRIFFSTLKEQKNIFCLMFFGNFIVFFALLFLSGRFFLVYNEAADEYEDTKTMYINVENFLFDEQGKILLESLMNKYYLREIMLFNSEQEVVGCEASENPDLTVSYGRYFTKEEQNGDNVVLVSEGYLGHCDAEFIKEMLKKQIIIKECPYKVIGRYNFVISGDVTNSSEVVIPLRTFIQNEFSFEKIKLVFYKSPAKATIASIEHDFNQIGVHYSINTLPKFEKNAIILAIEETGWSLFILIVCILSFFPLLQYWNKVIYKRMYVYYLCGCSLKKILLLLFNITTYVYSLSFILALFIYKLIKKFFSVNGYINELNWEQTVIMFLLIILSALIYLIKTNPLKVIIKNK